MSACCTEILPAFGCEPCTLGSTRPPRVEPSGAVVRARVWVGGWRVDHAPGTPGQSGCAIGLNHLGWCCGMSDNKRSSLSALLKEERRFAPPADLAANANVTAEAYESAKADRLGFWAEQARRLTGAKAPTETLDWSNPPFAKWFQDGELNVAYNCVDRHVEAGNGDRVAIHFEGEPGDSRTLTYAQLKDEVSRAANALRELGVEKGDRVAVYLPMIPEAVVAML